MQVNIRHTSSTLSIVGGSRRKEDPHVLFVRPAQMSLFARVTCYPPLGQVTPLQRIQKALRSENHDAVSAINLLIPDVHDYPECPYRKLQLKQLLGSVHSRHRVEHVLSSSIMGSSDLAQYHELGVDGSPTSQMRFINSAIAHWIR